MNRYKFVLTLFMLSIGVTLFAQQNGIIPDLSAINNKGLWVLHNREAVSDQGVHLDSKPGDGLLWIKEPVFSNGKIELDIKGKNEQGRSFVGIAFHGVNEETYDVIYFRPFNFKNPDRNGHSVQYISHPDYTWLKLREDFPEKYENPVKPVPDPDSWFHATITINYPTVNVYLNGSIEPSLTVEQLSTQGKGWIGFWVGNNSEGSFKNLHIFPEQ